MYYAILFIVSVILTGIYAGIWRKRFSVFITLNFALMPIANLGYYMVAVAQTVPEAILGIKVSYLGIFPHVFIMYAIFNLCNLMFAQKSGFIPCKFVWSKKRKCGILKQTLCFFQK